MKPRLKGWLWVLGTALVALAVIAGTGIGVVAKDSTAQRWFMILFSSSIASCVAFAVAVALEDQRRDYESERAVGALYQELLFLTFRCAWDFGKPWKGFWKSGKQIPKERAQKFVPDTPIVFTSLSDGFALVPNASVARLQRFHQGLDLWRRELEFRLANDEGKDLATESTDLLVKRLCDALQLGQYALVEMRNTVPKWETIEQQFRTMINPVERKEAATATFIADMSQEAERLAGRPLF